MHAPTVYYVRSTTYYLVFTLLMLRRAYSAIAAPPRYEHVKIACRSNGAITLDIFHASTPSAPIVLYLPPGPVLPDCSDQEERLISLLRTSSRATVARINYRASTLYPYPSPCHDVLAAYDWIRENLLRDQFNRPYLARLGVFGELIGGSLATMLALTECRQGESRIAAAAVNNPISDWVFPDDLPFVYPSELPEPAAADETAVPADEDLVSSQAVRVQEERISKPRPTQQRRPPKSSPLTAWHTHGHNMVLPTSTLSRERRVLFRRPDDCFDRFASPIHFFRSPHAQLVAPKQEDSLYSLQPDESIDMETRMYLNHYVSVNGSIEAGPVLPTLAKCRSYARNFPSAGMKLSLPVWNITTGSHSPLSDQVAELAKLLRRSTARHALKTHSGRTRWHDAAEKLQYEEFALERVLLKTHSGLGLWTRQQDDPNWKTSVEEVGVWMKKSLELDFN